MADGIEVAGVKDGDVRVRGLTGDLPELTIVTRESIEDRARQSQMTEDEVVDYIYANAMAITKAAIERRGADRSQVVTLRSGDW